MNEFNLSASQVIYTGYGGIHKLEEILLVNIGQNPGIRYRELLRLTNSSNGVLSYHLDELERLNLIRVDRKKSSTRFYLVNISHQVSNVIGYVRSPTSRRILSLLLENGPCTLEEITEFTNKSSSTIFWHVKRLVQAGIVIKKQSRDSSNIISKSKFYDIVDRALVSNVVSNYVETYVEKVVNNYTEIMDSL